MTSRRISRKATFALVGVVLLATAGLATAAATGAADDIVPIMKGRFPALERSLARDSVALAVHVGTFDGEARSPAAGAVVSVYLMPGPRPDRVTDRAPERDLPTATPIATETTDADGRAVFELRPGRYMVAVTYDDDAGRHLLPVPRDTRLNVVFDAEGNAHFGSNARHDLVRHGEPRVLMVRVGETDGHNRSATPGALVSVARVVETDAGPRTEPVTNGTTDENGTVVFQLRPGRYVVEVTTPGGDTTHVRVALRSNTGLLVMFDEDGNAHTRTLERGDRFDHDGRPPQRPSDRPTRDVPQRDAPQR